MNYFSLKFHSENGLPREFWYIDPVGEQVVHATDKEIDESMFFHANGHSDFSKGPFIKYIDAYVPAKKTSKQTRRGRKRKNGKKKVVVKQNSLAEDSNFQEFYIGLNSIVEESPFEAAAMES